MLIYMQTKLRIVISLLLLFSSAAVDAFEKISLHAIFGEKAMLLVDGKRHLLKKGEITPEGIKLISTDTIEEVVVVEINGEQEVLKLGLVASTAIVSSKEDIFTLWADPRGHFFTDGKINGTTIRFLVDTGATSIALNSQQAERIGLDYKIVGKKGWSNTASGVVPIYTLKLNEVRVGKITLHNIDAAVIEGAYPTEALLGMSFLRKVNLTREGNQLHFLLKH